MSRIKPGFRKTMKVICFMLVLTCALLSFSYMLAPKDNTKKSGINNPNANGFFSEPKDSIDLAVIGNSDAYSGFSPMELWNNYGYTSYVSAEGRQSIDESYTMLTKILTCHKPKAVILETDCFYTKTGICQSFVNIFNASMGSSLSIFQYHDRWKNVKLKDVFRKPKYTAHCSTKGQMLSNKVKPYDGEEYMIETDEVENIPMSSRAALGSFIKLCKENDIELIFVELPSESSWSYKRHNAVQKFADENDIDFIDMNLDREKFDFDWKTDTRDAGNHLNSRGARKATLFLGKYLEKNLDLTDHRNDPKFSEWNKDFESYIKEVKI